MYVSMTKFSSKLLIAARNRPNKCILFAFVSGKVPEFLFKIEMKLLLVTSWPDIAILFSFIFQYYNWL